MGADASAEKAEIKEIDGGRKLLITRDGAEVEVYLFGATLTKFKTKSGKDVIWLSSTAKLDGTKAIRGGIPLVFPQFGAPIKEMAQHGFARNNTWKLRGHTDDGVILTLDNTAATHDAWKYPYKLTFTIALSSESLTTTYSVENTGTEAFPFHSLQHTYLNVADISKTTVTGLRGQRFMDKTTADPAALTIETREVIRVEQFTDRIYVGPTATGKGAQVKVSGPTMTVDVSGTSVLKGPDGPTPVNNDVVMWNPWEKNAKGMGDFDDDGYNRMLCIEPGLVSGFHLLPAGSTFDLVQELKVSEPTLSAI